jgi:hypothetical protein
VGGEGPSDLYHEESIAVRLQRAETIERMNRSGRHCQCQCGAALATLLGVSEDKVLCMEAEGVIRRRDGSIFSPWGNSAPGVQLKGHRAHREVEVARAVNRSFQGAVQ